MKYLNKTVFSLVVAGISLLSGNVSAQFLGGHRLKSDEDGPKGQFMVYGSLDYSKITTPSSSSSTVSSAPLGLGYFINNNDLVGVNYAYSQNTVDHNVVYKQNEAGIWYSPSLMLGKYFVLIGQVDAHYVWGQQLSTAADRNITWRRMGTEIQICRTVYASDQNERRRLDEKLYSRNQWFNIRGRNLQKLRLQKKIQQ